MEYDIIKGLTIALLKWDIHKERPIDIAGAIKKAVSVSEIEFSDSEKLEKELRAMEVYGGSTVIGIREDKDEKN